MTVLTIGPGVGSSAYGFDSTIEDVPTIGLGQAVADAPGLHLLAVLAGAGRQLRVSVHDPSGALIAHLPRRRGVQGMVEHNTPGSGSLVMEQYDDVFADHPDLWDEGNIVITYLQDTPIGAWVMEAWSYANGPSGERELTRSGRGRLAQLDNGILFPERTLHRLTTEDRFFNFGSRAGAWYVASQWVRPKGVRYWQSHRYPYPKRWPFKAAQWLWSTSPERRTSQAVNYFRATLTLGETTRVKMWAVGDDSMTLLVDGELVMRNYPNGWKRPKTYTTVLPPGSHVIAAAVHNDGSADNDKSGFLFGAARVNKKGERIETLLLSNPNRWKVRRERTTVPGWFPSQVLAAFVSEGASRGVLGFDGIDVGFTDTRDSSGRPWVRRISQSYKIGTRGLDLVQQLVERGFDVAMTPLGKLQVWIDRGRDLRAHVALDGWTSSSGSGASSHVVNHALVRFRGGWTEVGDTPSKVELGRREVGLTAGGSIERREAVEQARAVFREFAAPEATYEVATSSLKGPQPFLDYDLYDVVTAPTQEGRGPCRVLSIAWTETDAGDVEWTHQLYPET